ncbi:Alpha-D-glucose-1-phosphate phosphatase YihX [Rubripirellula lacrimiformis]|uniref:Alpha-D-glucose-1-phosphate phosphatase YihX n=1 Tax=Rubripirellula lacrimiformis TaxID=1930273 RepID=A0A517N6M9_9BACT|nr:HAD family phosphatase [Rubripirellula lacrimiformis]QDT02770.1 Alpha-D-glucose-1-phosphate phosphatase YihX [Rubripirellula lacrimiformis]
MSDDGRIRFVYFDLGNVLLSFDEAIAHANLAKLFGVSASHAKTAVYDSGLENRFEQGVYSPGQFATEVCLAIGATGNPPTPAQICDAISDMFTPIDGMQGVMAAVRGLGFGVGILSNTCHAHWDWVVRHDYDVVLRRPDATILSYEIESMKPDGRIYEAAEAAAAVDPSEILFIDDKPENVAAAAQRGWQAKQCFGGREAVGVLGEMGVLA